MTKDELKKERKRFILQSYMPVKVFREMLPGTKWQSNSPGLPVLLEPITGQLAGENQQQILFIKLKLL